MLTAVEVADLLRIAKNTVYELAKRGELPCYRVGKKFRFDRSEIESFRRAAGSEGRHPGTAAGPLLGQLAAPTPEERSADGSRDDFVLCGQDMILDHLARRLEERSGARTLRSYMGSYAGLQALYMGQVDAASAHLWDSGTETYNLPFLPHLVPGTPVVVARLATRTVGFYVRQGNPKGLSAWEDLNRDDLTMVNRERGSGIRVLIDGRLRRLGIAGGSIPGYERECSTHLAVASAVSRGSADFGIGNEKTGLQVAGIDFIPLQEEQYDLVVRAEDAGRPSIRALLEIVQSADFREELAGFGGYGTADTGSIFRS